MSFVSYSQNFEDFMLWKALKQTKNGFYIDVGAYDPTEESVTKYFYDNGWSGINIEPVISYYKKFLLERPRDINLNILVSDKEEETNFYENSATGISSVVEDNIKNWEKESNFKFKKIKKVAKTLDTICVDNKVSIVHFLKIDVEGFEMNVLKSFSFDTVRPWIVLFEAVSPTGDHTDISSDCVLYLKSKKYHEVYFDGLNKFFVSDEHRELDVVFVAPLNVFDQSSIELNDSHWLVLGKLRKAKQANQQKEQEMLRDKQKIIDDIKKEEQLISSKLDATLTNLNSTKSQLESKNKELFEINNSRGWKTIVLIRKSVNSLIPIGSSRRQAVKYLFRLFNFPLKKKPETIVVSDELKNLSPRARKIYNDLRSAVNHSKNG